MPWIKITDRLPTKEECEKYYGWFLVVHTCDNTLRRPELSRYDGHEEEYCYTHGWKYQWDECISHWMPLPDLPKE